MKFLPARLRKTVLEMAYAGSTVHIGCAFSIIEILSVLYRSHLNLGDGSPRSPNRDYLVLSKGHGVMAQYACMRELGWITTSDCEKYFSDGTILKGLSDAHVPGLEVSSGSLGHGLSVGVGMALGAMRKKSGQRCFAIVGDGEMNEGAIWEALLFAAHSKLGNLVVIVDENGYQAMGTTTEVLGLGNLQRKFEDFGFLCTTVDGHDEEAIDAALSSVLCSPTTMPKALVARTIKGKGVSFMEGHNAWHYTRLTDITYGAAVQELEAAIDPR